MNLIAEDLLLLLIDDTTGKLQLDATRLDRALAGALLLELALAERVGEPKPGQRFGRDRITVLDSRPTGDDVLDTALSRLGGERPPGAARAVEKLVKGTRQALLARLVEAGEVREERGAALGIFPTARWPAVSAQREAATRQRLHEVLVLRSEPDVRTAALVSLLVAVDAVAKVVPAPDRRDLVRRARQVAEGDWAGVAVRKAVDAVHAALLASTGALAATTITTT